MSARPWLRAALASMLVLAFGCARDRGDRSTTVSAEDDYPPPPAPRPPPPAPRPPPPAPSSSPAPAEDGPFYLPDPKGRPVAILRGGAPNVRYASLDQATCEAELGKRGVPFARGEATKGVLAPVRLRGPLHGIAIHSTLPTAQRERSHLELFDCRLVLALDDFAEMIAPHGVVEIVHYSAYRTRREYGCTAKYLGKQHCAALAVDVGELRKKDGSVLKVDRDFHGRIGLGTCSEGVGPSPATPAASELWGFVCDAARRAIFHVILTPNFNAQHFNHFHLEITPDARWMMIH